MVNSTQVTGLENIVKLFRKLSTINSSEMFLLKYFFCINLLRMLNKIEFVVSYHLMKTRFINLVATLVVSLSCLFWITLSTLGMVRLLGVSTQTALGVGGALAVLSALAIVLMGREFENAIEIPGYDDSQEAEEGAEAFSKKSLALRGKPAFLQIPRENF